MKHTQLTSRFLLLLLSVCLMLTACKAPETPSEVQGSSESSETSHVAAAFNERTDNGKGFSEDAGEESESRLPSEEDSSVENAGELSSDTSVEESSAPVKTPENAPMAVELTETTEFDADEDVYDWYNLLDADYDTYHYFAYNTAVTLTSETPIAGVWVIFHFAPGEWTVEAGDQTIECGKYGMIHEYVAIDKPSTTVTLNIPWDTYVCDFYVFSEGTLPDWVQVWNPPCDKADIAVFPTHADDELLFFGGVIPYYAGELGLKVQVIYLTYHDLPRPHELLNGLWVCGDTYYPIIGPFYDLYCTDLYDALNTYSEWAWVDFEVEMLRRFKPSVIVCHDENGEYGHGAHCLNTYCMEQAVEAAADPDEFTDSAEEYGVWDTPKMYIHLYEERQLVMDWHVPLDRFGGRTALDMAIAGYEFHYSQHQYAFAVEEEGYGDCRLFGLYRTTVGEDTPGTADMMEHITTRY